MDQDALPEYKTEQDQSTGIPVVSCWVPSEAGKVRPRPSFDFSPSANLITSLKTFRIDVTPPPPPRIYNWTFKLRMDGIRIRVLLDNSIMKNETEGVVSLKHNMVADGKTRTFRFGAVKVMEDDEAAARLGSVEALGEIELLMYSVESYEERVVRVKYEKGRRGTSEIHEAAKQRVQHCAQYVCQPLLEPFANRSMDRSGEEREEAETPDFLKAVGRKLAGKVVFKYRDIGWLVCS
jgi:hypothetical protein